MSGSFSGKFPVKFAAFSESTIDNHAVVAAVAGKSIRVLSYVLAVAGTSEQVIIFKSGTTALTGPMPIESGISAHFEVGLFQTARGEALNIDLGGAIQTSGHITYVLV
jgi:hypothetical protein